MFAPRREGRKRVDGSEKDIGYMYPWSPIEERKIARDVQAFADVIAASGDVLPF